MNVKKGLRTITRKDIAEEAGVTETIVSYVINGNRYVKEEKRKRVQEAIKKLGYRPNTMARALKGKKSNHLLLIADDIEGEYFGKLISEIDSLAYREGYFISLCADHKDEDFVNRIYSKFFDGIIIGSASFPLYNIQRLIDAGVPVVLLEIRDYHAITGVYGLINTGLYKGARECVRTLYQKGRRNLLFLDRITADGKGSDLDDWRLKGFIEESQELGLEVDERHILTGYHSEDELLSAFAERVASGFVPDGLMGRNDHIALIGMDACKQVGYAVPDDISVIGFDNSRLCRFAQPPLTTMGINQKEIAKTVMRMMVSLIDQRSEHDARLEAYLHTQLVMRESV
ncbi:MAG: LacI family DNA-binding transcriptional regulator [Sphaerochaetaceae bacterium]